MHICRSQTSFAQMRSWFLFRAQVFAIKKRLWKYFSAKSILLKIKSLFDLHHCSSQVSCAQSHSMLSNTVEMQGTSTTVHISVHFHSGKWNIIITLSECRNNGQENSQRHRLSPDVCRTNQSTSRVYIFRHLARIAHRIHTRYTEDSWKRIQDGSWRLGGVGVEAGEELRMCAISDAWSMRFWLPPLSNKHWDCMHICAKDLQICWGSNTSLSWSEWY